MADATKPATPPRPGALTKIADRYGQDVTSLKAMLQDLYALDSIGAPLDSKRAMVEKAYKGEDGQDHYLETIDQIDILRAELVAVSSEEYLEEQVQKSVDNSLTNALEPLTLAFEASVADLKLATDDLALVAAGKMPIEKLHGKTYGEFIMPSENTKITQISQAIQDELPGYLPKRGGKLEASEPEPEKIASKGAIVKETVVARVVDEVIDNALHTDRGGKVHNTVDPFDPFDKNPFKQFEYSKLQGNFKDIGRVPMNALRGVGNAIYGTVAIATAPIHSPLRTLRGLGNFANLVATAAGAVLNTTFKAAGATLKGLGSVLNEGSGVILKAFRDAGPIGKTLLAIPAALAAVTRPAGMAFSIAGEGLEHVGKLAQDTMATLGQSARLVTNTFSFIGSSIRHPTRIKEEFANSELGSTYEKLVSTALTTVADVGKVAGKMVSQTGTELKELGNDVGEGKVGQALRGVGNGLHAVGTAVEGTTLAATKTATAAATLSTDTAKEAWQVTKATAAASRADIRSKGQDSITTGDADLSATKTGHVTGTRDAEISGGKSARDVLEAASRSGSLEGLKKAGAATDAADVTRTAGTGKTATTDKVAER